MRKIIAFTSICSFIVLCCNQPASKSEIQSQEVAYSNKKFNDSMLHTYMENLKLGFDSIPADRKNELLKLSQYIKAQLDSNANVKLTFICTHNSRRSHLAQIWATTAAAHFDIKSIACYSGGTEATAFNTRAIAGLQRAGFTIEMVDSNGTNPKYRVQIPNSNPIICYSKKFNDISNPSAGFAAVMTCSKADAECPFVPGAGFRLAIPYEDPKEADNTPEEKNRYDERTKQIGTEMMFLFSKVKQ